MKKLMFLFVIGILFSGCEKERCFECTTTLSGISSGSQRSVICGTMTRKEAKEAAQSASISSGGITIKVSCKKQ